MVKIKIKIKMIINKIHMDLINLINLEQYEYERYLPTF